MDDKKTALNIAESKKRVFDQLASMHFRLSDEYNALAHIEDAIEIIVSVVLCGITFLDYQEYFNISIQKPMLLVGFISIFLLAFNLIKQRLGHKQLSEKYQMAGKMYTQAKINLTGKLAEWSTISATDEIILNYIDVHFSSLNELPQIPEKAILPLKALASVKGRDE